MDDATAATRHPRSGGFTLIELLIVVAIIGIIASIAIPNLMNAMDRAKQNSSMANMRALGVAVEKYAIDNNVYPTAADITALEEVLEPDYIQDVPRRDGWSNALVYLADSDGRGFTIKSYGKDGAEQANPPGGEIGSFDEDIIYVDGQFVQWPAGRQQ